MSLLVKWYLFYTLLVTASSSSLASTDRNVVYKIEGKILFPPNVNALHETRILVNEGEFIGIPHIDRSFVITGIPSGSYTVSINSPHHIFESVRVDINKNGKIRARKLNLISSPMFLILVIPIFLFFVLPIFIPRDPQTQNALEQANDIFQTQWDLPDLADICIRIFGGVHRQRPET